MTLNNRTMTLNKDCFQLDVERKMRIKIDVTGKILYVNKYFTEVAQYPIHEVILKDIDDFFHIDTPKLAKQWLLNEAEKETVSYFVFKGKVANNDCFWGFVRISQEMNEFGELKGYLLEIKMLPIPAIDKIEKLHDILKEIENNAGINAAKKYFEGYLEEKNLTFKDFILNLTEINEKKAEKYFQIDIDKQSKKKSWF